MSDRREWLLKALNLAWRHGYRYARNEPSGALGRGDMLAILDEHEAAHGRDDRPFITDLERFGVHFVDDDEVIGVYWLPAPKGQPVAGSLREALEARAAELRAEGAAAMRADLLVVDAGKLDLRCENDRLSGLDGAVAALGTSEAGIDIDNAYGWGGVISVGGKSMDTEAETLRTLLIAMAAKLPAGGASE